MRGLTRPATILRRARAAIPALRELLAEEPGPRTSLNRVIGQDRTLAVVRSSLESVDEVAHLHGAKVNDVLLAVIAGGLRGLLRSRGEPIEAVTSADLRARFAAPGPFRSGRGESDQPDGRPASSWDRRSWSEAAADRPRDRQTEGDRPSVAGHDVPQQARPRGDAQAHRPAAGERRER